jgi:predicted acetyltransferase
MNISLIEPRIDLEESYLSLIQEFQVNGEPLIPFPLTFPHQPFSDLLTKLQDHSKGIGIPEGFVPNSTFWLIEEEREIVAVSNLRHALTAKLRREGGHIGYGVRPSQRRKGYGKTILRETLVKAWELGLEKVLITCGKANIASAKVILKNGGVFESEDYIPERDEVVQRYWITFSQE